MNEVQLTTKIRTMICRQFPDVYVQRVSDRFLSGIPDLRVICKGFSGDIEVKTFSKSSRTTKIQDKVLERIAAAGGACCVVRSVDEARDWMKKFTDEARRKSDVLDAMSGRTCW